MAAEESGLRSHVPIGRIRGFTSSVLETPWPWETHTWGEAASARPVAAEGQAEAGRGEADSLPHAPVTRQRGRTAKGRGGGGRRRGDDHHFSVRRESPKALRPNNTSHTENKPNLLLRPSPLYPQAAGPERGG